MRRAAKVDRNQGEIVNTFRKLGWSVQVLSVVGEGCPDIVVGRRGFNLFVEIKDGQAVPSDRRLTKAQVGWHASWKGQVAVLKNIDEVIEFHDNEIKRIIKAYQGFPRKSVDIIT